MPSHTLVYPMQFMGLDEDGKYVYHPYLPIIVKSVKTGRSISLIGLADTGADSNLIPGGITHILGADINTGISKPGGGTGIGNHTVALWKHDLQITLLTPDRRNIAFELPPASTDCCEESAHSLLLGTIGFLEYFKSTFDHTATQRKLILEWRT